jgi:hypothetical protein
MAFTSIGRSKDLTTMNHRGIYTISCIGRVTHSIGAFEPEKGASHHFAQVYLLNALTAVNARLQHRSVAGDRAQNELNREIMITLAEDLVGTVPYRSRTRIGSRISTLFGSLTAVLSQEMLKNRTRDV